MTDPTVRAIRLGITNSYLIGTHGRYVLVDAGTRGREAYFFRKLGAAGIRPADIGLIVVTHVHFDHVGSLAAIRKRCGCPVAVHASEAPMLREGRIVLPPGTRPYSRWLIGLARRHPWIVERLYRFDPVEADILVEQKFSLDGFGVKARALHTPGHTAGSLSVLTAAGDAAVGDLAVNYHPFGRRRHAPPFGDSPELIRHQWRRLLTLGARQIYPAHGRPFPARRLSDQMAGCG
jgi:glyoxylase-like metal-dependent hydrolase (beta-lactamase superfamily II)